MNLGFPVQERPARSALTAGFNCARIMWKAVAGAMRSSTRPAFSSIGRSTQSQPQRIMGNFRNEKGLRDQVRELIRLTGFSQKSF